MVALKLQASARDEAWKAWVDGLHEALAEAKAGLARGAVSTSELTILMRAFHLIKGYAQALGLHGVQSAAHELESKVSGWLEGPAEDRPKKAMAILASGIGKLDAVISGMHEIELRRAAIREAAVCRVDEEPRATRVSALFSRIESAARGIALDLGQTLEFDARTGGDLLLEPEWEAPLEAALLHTVRNSLDHGTLTRTRRATSPILVVLSAEIERNEWVIKCRDTGTGIDPARVREAARARQARFDAELGSMSDVEVLQLLFLPGLSLSRGVSKLSGRGYGLDIVREAIQTKLGGKVRIESQLGIGTRLILRIPVRR